MIDYGTDIHNTWTFKDGDLQLTQRNEDNIIQALQNRLMTPYGHFYWCYGEQYGSDLLEILGEYNTTRIAEYVMISIQYTVLQDPRVQEVTDITYTTEDSNLIVNVTVQLIGDSEDIGLQLVITDNHTVTITGDTI